MPIEGSSDGILMDGARFAFLKFYDGEKNKEEADDHCDRHSNDSASLAEV